MACLFCGWCSLFFRRTNVKIIITCICLSHNCLLFPIVKKFFCDSGKGIDAYLRWKETLVPRSLVKKELRNYTLHTNNTVLVAHAITQSNQFNENNRGYEL